MLNQDELKALLPLLEDDRVEKTVSRNNADKFGEAICSFCNDMSGHGLPGYLIIGANDDGTLDGTKSDEQIMQTLLAFRTDGRIVPPPAMSVKAFSFPEGEVTVVEVMPSLVPPARYKGKVCIRTGPRKGIANETEERILSEKRSTFARSFDTQPAFGSKLDDLSLEIFKLTYLPTAIDRETLEANGREIKEQLSSLKFYDLKQDCPTNAGILLFGKNPRFYLSGAYVQYVKFNGDDETSEFEFEHRFDGDLTTQMKVMDDFIKSQIVKRVQADLGQGYQEAYPASAIQELLYNAVIHKDYQSNAPIKFYEFSDRIEITNPGGLYGNARPENFPNKNDYRNPTLAEAAKNLGYINSFNVGVKRAISALVKNGSTEPKFIINEPTSFGVIIFKK
ncbi:transcriptional regulator [Mucilaginibacter sp. 14171R-50]|uniref:ATP-binding protein n=1 Tax=Mucilaginibacter sp. 14171R-50 TaxID=2703789 RepID=UPI00138BE66D|nr:ATP-binding protein [Mucilaginibacter sp. 14171R-50]QHS56516.1 transcriptional regulator [Mucilaginibacter sp. 14171R-50]